MPNAVPDRLLSPDEVALFLSVPVKTLYQWRYKGVGPRGLRVGKHLRYRQDEIEAWLEALDDPAGQSSLR